MIRLPNTGTYSLELITAQNGAQSVVSYSDATSSAYTGGTQVASITSATTTTICSTPAASTVRDVDQINIKNTFAGSHTVTVQVDANGTNFPLIVAALLTDESLNYTHGSGWQVKDANGNTKNSALSAMTSAQLAAILTDETGSGAAVFANGPTLIAPILGTPASGTVTNLTGTASININGTVGATTPAAGTFTTLTSTGNATLGDAEATDTHAIKGVTTLLANSASAALTITQTGAGNALVLVGSASEVARVTATGTTTLGGTSTAPALKVNPDPTANTRWVTITGSNGGNPTIGTSAGNLTIAPGGNTAAQFQAAAASVNYPVLYGQATGLGVSLGAVGSDSNIQLTLASKGTSGIALGTGVSTQVFVSATASANRYITLTGGVSGSNTYPTIGAAGTAAGTIKFTGGQIHPVATNTAGTLTIDETHYQIIQTTAASVYTLPAAANYTGRVLKIVTQFAGTVTSASSNVVPIAGGAAGTAILAATAGKFATLVSNGTNWIITEAN